MSSKSFTSNKNEEKSQRRKLRESATIKELDEDIQNFDLKDLFKDEPYLTPIDKEQWEGD